MDGIFNGKLQWTSIVGKYTPDKMRKEIVDVYTTYQSSIPPHNYPS